MQDILIANCGELKLGEDDGVATVDGFCDPDDFEGELTASKALEIAEQCKAKGVEAHKGLSDFEVFDTQALLNFSQLKIPSHPQRCGNLP